MKLEADAGDAAAGDLVSGKGLAVFVSEVEDREAEAMACPSQPVSFGGLFQPVDESFHLGADDLPCVPRKLMRMIMTVMSGIPRCPSERSHRRNSKARFCPW